MSSLDHTNRWPSKTHFEMAESAKENGRSRARRAGAGQMQRLSNESVSAQNSVISGAFRTMESSNESHGPWLFRTLSKSPKPDTVKDHSQTPTEF